ncbi:MAG TPA: protease inhibitor I9 family protein [Longimicrobiaceae bacterium]|nr:protease inhibitor I9 family protein [Longimicrobiaceae bacterium]
MAGALAREHGFTPSHVYESALLGFAARLTPAALAAVRCHPAVKYVEHDASARLF